MNENYIEIKEKRSGFMLKGFLLLASMLLSLFFASLPFITTSAKTLAVLFYLIGGTFFAATLALFVLHLYKELNPRNALILKAHGFIDCINVGENIEIDWTNVASVKMLGKKEDPFFGINLENVDIVLAKMNEKEADDLRDNIEDNFPAILISQSSIRMSVNELKDLFVKFVREARALESDAVKKQKNNPFTSEDVLRAFGKYDSKDIKEPVNNNTSDENDVDDSDVKVVGSNSTYDVHSDDTVSHSTLTDAFSGDLFYESIDKIIQSTPKTAEDTSESSEQENIVSAAQADETDTPTLHAKLPEDDTSREIEELLSKAKVSRITELEKLLADDFKSLESQEKPSEDGGKDGANSQFATKEFNLSLASLHKLDINDSDEDDPDIVIPDDVFEQ